jgi:hypothetical protein
MHTGISDRVESPAIHFQRNLFLDYARLKAAEPLDAKITGIAAEQAATNTVRPTASPIFRHHKCKSVETVQNPLNYIIGYIPNNQTAIPAFYCQPKFILLFKKGSIMSKLFHMRQAVSIRGKCFIWEQAVP